MVLLQAIMSPASDVEAWRFSFIEFFFDEANKRYLTALNLATHAV